MTDLSTDIYTVVILTYAIIGLCVVAAAVWATWFPTTRCQKIQKNAPYRHNVCILNKSHDGHHMSASGYEFEERSEKKYATHKDSARE